jgi:hypothetical protein
VGTALLKDLGIATPDKIIGRQKVMKEKKRLAMDAIDKRFPDCTGLTCIGFDSKHDAKVRIYSQIKLCINKFTFAIPSPLPPPHVQKMLPTCFTDL